MYQKIVVAQVGNVAVIRLNDPSTLNAITAEMLDEIARAFDDAAKSARAVLLTSVGRAFCAGANLTGGALSAQAELDAGELLETHVNPLILKLRHLPIPWISAVRGPAVGVGSSIALAADLVIASETAYFLQAFARIGLVPDGGSAWLLTKAVGRPRAMELMLLGEKLAARQALDWGLLNRVVADDHLDTAAIDLASRLARGPTRAFGLIRDLAWCAADAPIEASLEAERDAQRTAGRTADAIEGITAFAQKREAFFIGR